MRKEAGFTLIEVIVSLILVGIMASMAGMGIVAGVKGYLFAKDNAAVSGKAQLAMSRLNRTFMEVLDITTVESSPTRVTYKRLSGGLNTTETLYLDTTAHAIKIASGGNAAGGDTLVDNVSSLALTYQKGAANWVQGTDIFSLLSNVGVTLILTRPDGGNNATFSTLITPRNNGNTGGSPVTIPTTMPTTCFVATAAFGQPDHPIVLLLREFRDRYLLTWAGGRMMVKIYYAGGPYLADLIRDRVWACTLTQWILLPFAGIAFLMLYAPQTVLFIFLLSWVAVTVFLKFIRRRNKKMVASVTVNQRGTILLGLIGTMVIFSVLGAAMLSFTNSSIFNQLSSTGSTRAYYLAEGGMRYAASQFKNAASEDLKDEALVTLNQKTFNLVSGGTFLLNAYPYYFKTTAIPSGTTLYAKFPGSVPAGMSLPTNGYLKIGTDTTPRQYTGNPTVGTTTTTGTPITFQFSSALTGSAAVNNVLPVGVGPTSIATMSKSGSVLGTLTLSSGAGAFPPVNGTFTIGTASSTTGANPAVFAYKTRSGNILQDVTLSQTPTNDFSVAVPMNAYITSGKFVNLSSTGNYAPLQSSRTISYSVPIGWVAASGSDGKSKFTDTFGDLSHWNIGTSEGEVGSHQALTDSNTSGSNAVKVTGTTQFWNALTSIWSDRASLLTFDWTSGTGVDLNQSWNMAGKFLSYDAQVKVNVAAQPNYFMAGMIFREQGSNSYGVSFLRPNQGSSLTIDNDGIPDDLCPLANSNHDILIVLWEQTSATSVQWLAYKRLTGVDTGVGGVIDTDGHLAPWSTILVRVIEAASLEFNTGTGPTPLVGDTITGTNGATARVNGTPILSSGAWGGTNAVGILTIDTLSTTSFVSGTLTVKRGATTIGTTVNYTGTSRPRDNYIRVYYGTQTNKGIVDNSPLLYLRSGNVRITTTTATPNWPADDVTAWGTTGYPDAFTLVQWDGLNLNTGSGYEQLSLGTGTEASAIIRTHFLTTDHPAQTTFISPEVGLDTWGTNAKNNVYFDDFGIQTASPGQTQGFLPAIQQ